MEGKEDFVTEIPPYRMPNLGSLLKKTFIRVREFLKEAVPYIALGMIVMNFFYLSGLDADHRPFLGRCGIGMFAPLDMTPEQLVIASVVQAMYFPCVAAFI